MNTTKWFFLSIMLFLALTIYAQNKTPQGVKITMQFQDQADSKKYECNNIYYRSDKRMTEDNDYDMSFSSYGLADNKLLEWASNPKMNRSIKITITKNGKSEREYILKNATVKTFAESGFTSDGSDINSTYDFTINAEQISINGTQMKGAN